MDSGGGDTPSPVRRSTREMRLTRTAVDAVERSVLALGWVSLSLILIPIPSLLTTVLHSMSEHRSERKGRRRCGRDNRKGRGSTKKEHCRRQSRRPLHPPSGSFACSFCVALACFARAQSTASRERGGGVAAAITAKGEGAQRKTQRLFIDRQLKLYRIFGTYLFCISRQDLSMPSRTISELQYYGVGGRSLDNSGFEGCLVARLWGITSLWNSPASHQSAQRMHAGGGLTKVWGD
jgi:hypothetical protein